MLRLVDDRSTVMVAYSAEQVYSRRKPRIYVSLPSAPQVLMKSFWKRLMSTSESVINSSNAATANADKKPLSKRALHKSQPSGVAPPSSLPIVADFDSRHLLIGAGVAIFHIASARVVLCFHSTNQYWFLPKGRRDSSEDSGSGAEREGFEEVTARPCPMEED